MRDVVCVACHRTFSTNRKRETCSAPCKKTRKSEYDRERHLQVGDATRSRAADWYWGNKERKQRYDIEYRRANSDKINEYRKRLYEKRAEDPSFLEQQVLRAHRYRSRKRSNGIREVTTKDLRRSLNRTEGRCSYCPDLACEWDHVIPVSRGGAHQIGNLVPACRSCNASKSNKTVMEWRIRGRAPDLKMV